MKLVILFLIASLQLMAIDAYTSAEDFTEKLNNKNIVILDVTDKAEYKKGHLPNAIRADISDFRHKVIMHKEINSPKDIQKLMRSYGINQNSEILLYGHGKKKELLKTTYMAMAFITHGVTKISLLDGGYAAWLEENPDSTSTKIPKISIGNYKVNFHKEMIVDANYVKSKIGKVRMIDARPPRYYYGSLLSGGVERYGHIPLAISSFWGDKFFHDKTIRDEDIIEEMMLSANKMKKNDEVICYCTGGLETSANWYILYQYLGFKNAKIYDGSMRDWGNMDNTPLVRYMWESPHDVPVFN